MDPSYAVRACVGATLAFMANCADADNFTITTDDYAPYTVVAEQNVTGVITDLISAALRKEGHTVEFVPVPWARAIAMVESGKASGTMPWFKTTEREMKFRFSDPVINVRNVIFFKKGGKFGKDLQWNGYGDLRPYRMGATIGYWYEAGFAKAGVPLDRVRKDEQNVQKLESGRIDGFITDELVGKLLISKLYPGREGEFDTVDKPDSASALHVMARLGSTEGNRLIDSIDAGLAKLKASGEFDKIIARSAH